MSDTLSRSGTTFCHVGAGEPAGIAAPVSSRDWSAFLYAGAGAVRYDLDQPLIPAQRTPGSTGTEWVAIVPVGVGAKIRLTKRIFADVAAGYTWTSTDKIDAVARGDDDDSYWGLQLGASPDPDRDRLYNKVEQRLGTNPRVGNPDGDGLLDGELREGTRPARSGPTPTETDCATVWS